MADPKIEENNSNRGDGNGPAPSTGSGPAPKVKTPEQKSDDALNARLDLIENGLKVQLEERDAEIADLAETVKNLSKNGNHSEDEIVETERRSANKMSLPMIEGAPIVKSEITAVLGVPGLELIASVENAKGEKFEVPFGCKTKDLDFTLKALKDVYTTSFEKLDSETFDLQDIDEDDLTGASKVDKKVVVSEGTLIPEIDRSSGLPVPTGRKIRTKVKKHVRYYTIKFGDEKFTLTNTELENIRI